MKMHKKLFGLLATAAVGLTLTSCGGGGGGGSSDTPTDTEDTPVVEVGAPRSLVGKTLKLVMNVANSESKNTYQVTFNSESTFTGTGMLSGKSQIDILNGNYTWVWDGPGQGRLTVFTFDTKYSGDGEPGPARDYSNTTLKFDAETGQFLSADNAWQVDYAVFY